MLYYVSQLLSFPLLVLYAELSVFKDDYDYIKPDFDFMIYNHIKCDFDLK